MSIEETYGVITDREKAALQVLSDRRDVYKISGHMIAEKTMTMAIVLVWQVYMRMAASPATKSFVFKLEKILEDYSRQQQLELQARAWIVGGKLYDSLIEAQMAGDGLGETPRALVYEDLMMERVRSAFRRGALFGDMRKMGSRGE